MGCKFSSSRAPMVAESNFSCCSQVTFVQDQICTPINITPVATAITQVLYSINVNPINIYVSGSIMIGAAPTGRTITVEFLVGGATGTVIETETITPGTSLAFTKTGFDTILLLIAAGTAVTPNITGEICVTPRYPVSG
ncbi:DUF3992 domain-containing protein [Paenibacillus ehimensis]|uniref:DUF3992 domain-containing protein n=1 Tax=Paenibacillus ehimensis TaxID=79264 RepID=UPI000470E783|nr:S-Ena type endospore appendage [Paenibacillus ehimensis]